MAAARLRACLLRQRRSSLAAANRQHEKYYQTLDDLAYLYSPSTLRDRAQLSIDLGKQLYDKAVNASTPREALDVIDTMNNTVCLLLDPAEATRSTHPSAAYRRAANEAFDEVFHFMSEMNTSRELYAALVSNFDDAAWELLSAEQQRNAKIMKDDMDSNGIHLPDNQRDHVVKLTAQKETLAHELMTAPSRDAQMQVLHSLIETRHNLAAFLGNASFARWTLSPTMAETPEQTWAFLNAMSTKLQGRGKEEADRLALLKAAVTGQKTITPVREREVHELAEIYKHQMHGTEYKRMREYLSVANVWRGLQLICKRLFGVDARLEEHMEDHERYHPTVQKYVLYEDGTYGEKGSKIGTIYADLISRPDKMPGAGHYTVQLGTTLHENVLNSIHVDVPPNARQYPIVIFSCNAEPGAEAPRGASLADYWETVLLSPDDMETLFHEFGHALHSLFGQTQCQNLAGTRSSLDYVEAFSQFLEYYAKDPRVLREFAFHYKTGEPVPVDLALQAKQAESVTRGVNKLNQLVLAAADLVFHGPRPLACEMPNGELRQFAGIGEVMPALRAQHLPFYSPTPSLEEFFSLQHIANYPSAYYSYAYSGVIAASIWSKHFRDDPWCAEGGRKLRHVMSLGASQRPQDMLRHLFEDGVTDPAVLMKDLDVETILS